MTGDYGVGYGRPPKTSRFKKGKSGNPRGRPKSLRNFKTDFTAALKAPVRVTESGKARTISTQQAVIARLREKALNGDVRALDRIITLSIELGETAQESKSNLSMQDRDILDRYGDRLLRRREDKPKAHNE